MRERAEKRKIGLRLHSYLISPLSVTQYININDDNDDDDNNKNNNNNIYLFI